MIDQVTKPGDRRHFYRYCHFLHVQMLTRWLERMQQVREVVTEGERVLAPENPKVLWRFQNVNLAHLQVITSMKQNLQQLRTTDPVNQRENAAEER